MVRRTGAAGLAGVISVLALPALAQDTGLCGAVGEGAQWMAGDEAASDVMTATAPFDETAVAILPGGTALRAFILSSPGDIRIEAAPGLGGDTVIELYSADGTLVLTDDDSGGGLASRAETTLEPGTYCAVMLAFDGSPLVTDIRIARQEFEALTQGLAGEAGYFAGVPSCLPDTEAVELGVIDGQLAQGITATNSVGEVPYYRFTLEGTEALTIMAENEWADPYIYIYDGTGGLIGENDDFDGYNSQVDFTEALAPDTYCVALRALSSPSEPVTLSILDYDPNRVLWQAFASGDTPPSPGSGYPITALGALNTQLIFDQPVGADAVWYSFDLPEGGLVDIEAVGITESDPMIALYDADGTFRSFNDDSPRDDSLNSQMADVLPPGRYMLAAMQYDESYSGVIRVTLTRWVLAD